MSLTELILGGALLGSALLAFGGLETKVAHADEKKAEAGQGEKTPEPKPYSYEWYKNEYQDAESLEKALKEKPTSDGYVRLSDYFLKSKEQDKAKAAVEKALELGKDNHRAHHAAGRYFQFTQEYKKAEEYLKTAENLAPKDWTIKNALGYLYQHAAKELKGNEKAQTLKAAEVKYSEAIELSSGHYAPINNMARLKYDQGCRDESKALFIQLKEKLESMQDKDQETQSIYATTLQWINHLK